MRDEPNRTTRCDAPGYSDRLKILELDVQFILDLHSSAYCGDRFYTEVRLFQCRATGIRIA